MADDKRLSGADRECSSAGPDLLRTLQDQTKKRSIDCSIQFGGCVVPEQVGAAPRMMECAFSDACLIEQRGDV